MTLSNFFKTSVFIIATLFALSTLVATAQEQIRGNYNDFDAIKETSKQVESSSEALKAGINIFGEINTALEIAYDIVDLIDSHNGHVPYEERKSIVEKAQAMHERFKSVNDDAQRHMQEIDAQLRYVENVKSNHQATESQFQSEINDLKRSIDQIESQPNYYPEKKEILSKRLNMKSGYLKTMIALGNSISTNTSSADELRRGAEKLFHLLPDFVAFTGEFVEYARFYAEAESILETIDTIENIDEYISSILNAFESLTRSVLTLKISQPLKT